MESDNFFRLLIESHTDPHLVSNAMGDLEFIGYIGGLTPEQQSALERARLRLHLLGTRADAREILEAQQCQSG